MLTIAIGVCSQALVDLTKGLALTQQANNAVVIMRALNEAMQQLTDDNPLLPALSPPALGGQDGAAAAADVADAVADAEAAAAACDADADCWRRLLLQASQASLSLMPCWKQLLGS